MSYRAPLREYQLIMEHIIGYDRVSGTELFGEAGTDTVQAILSEAAKLSEDVLAPLQRAGDTSPAVLEAGQVRTSPGFVHAYEMIKEGAWTSIGADPDHGGMGLPATLTCAVNEMMASACLALQLQVLMSQGQIEALQAHASAELQALYLPKLISGAWTGTMNLTEPQAGSDVGALTTKATPLEDGSYAITGQKIYITWGDNDFTENVIHLILARLPDAVPGTKGISLFLVPRNLVAEDGTVGEMNNLHVVGLEHKLGLHGSPTCTMAYQGAIGQLVGAPHQGMRAMFTMMNNARLGVGVQGLGVAEGAYQAALAYAQERKQGRSETGTIFGHADVRRMLATMKADIFATRAICLDCAVALDLGRTGDAPMQARAAFLTPIAKAFGTDIGHEVAHMGIQVHGGMGFIEESGVAQFARDVRVTQIYEGTNGIQAMDLVARKLMDGGEAAFAILDEIEAGAEAARLKMPKLAEAVWQSAEALRENVELLLRRDMADRFSGSVPFLRGFARVLGAHYHLRAAMAEPGTGRERLARFYITRLLPEYQGLLAHAAQDSATLMALSDEDFRI